MSWVRGGGGGGVATLALENQCNRLIAATKAPPRTSNFVPDVLIACVMRAMNCAWVVGDPCPPTSTLSPLTHSLTSLSYVQGGKGSRSREDQGGQDEGRHGKEGY